MTRTRRWLALLLGLMAWTACTELGTTPIPTPPARVLVFSKTSGFRHASIPAGIDAIRALGVTYGFETVFTEDAALFTDASLAAYDAVIFLQTTGDVLDDTQQAAFERFLRANGGFVGIHAAADAEYNWAWYGGLVGAYFASHPAIQSATVITADSSHPSTLGFPASFSRTDEWYNFAAQPSGVTLLLRLDPASYTGGTMGATQPLAWYHEYDGGRAWYTAMGHTVESYSEPRFRAHIAGGILWATRRR